MNEDFYFRGKELPEFALSPVLSERTFDDRKAHAWMIKNWTLSAWVGVAYLLAISWLLRWMRGRKPFDLSRTLFLWNISLALFSVAGTLRTLPEFVWILGMEDGHHKSICDVDTLHSPAGRYWVWLFVMSKIFELGDTVFLVLRKRPLSFLHVYHHFTVLIFSWYMGSLYIIPPTARWFTTMNFTVHSVMYTYYAVQSLKLVKVPRWLSMSITIMQTVQMVAGVWVNFYAYQVKRGGEACAVSDDALNAAAGIYFSYFLLFSWFFYQAYFVRRSSRNKLKPA